MNIVAVYTYPMVKSDLYRPLARRFIQTWKQFPPGDTTISLFVGTNGRMHNDDDLSIFRSSGIPFEVIHHDNRGWDIGLFQLAAELLPCDLLVCFGAPVHFYRPGWGDRIADVFCSSGPALFGAWGVPHRMNWHIRTTAFWFQPQLLQSYPNIVGSSRMSRYAFEHGDACFTTFAERVGFEPLMVTWSGVHPKRDWPAANGGPGNCLMLDQHNNFGK